MKQLNYYPAERRAILFDGVTGFIAGLKDCSREEAERWAQEQMPGAVITHADVPALRQSSSAIQRAG